MWHLGALYYREIDGTSTCQYCGKGKRGGASGSDMFDYVLTKTVFYR